MQYPVKSIKYGRVKRLAEQPLKELPLTCVIKGSDILLPLSRGGHKA